MEKKINITLGALLALSAAPGVAMADAADNFKGANVSLGFSVESSTFETRERGEGTWAGTGSSASSYSGSFSYDRQIEWPHNSAKFGGKMELGYNFKVSENFLLGAALAGDFSRLQSGQTNSSTTEYIDCNGTSASTTSVTCSSSAGTGGTEGTSSSGGYTDTANLSMRNQTTHVSLKNRYGLALRPMFMVTEQTALYMKFSYNTAQTDTFGPRLDVSGPGFGLGVEANLSGRWFVRAEIEQIAYAGRRGDRAAHVIVNGTGAGFAGGAAATSYTSGRFSADLKSTISTISVGYRF